MSRNPRNLSLALVAVLALSAVAASSASALVPRLTSPGNYPLTLSGSQKAGAINEFILPGGKKFTCTSATFAGTQTEEEATGGATKKPWEASVAPTYSGCTGFILGNPDPVTVTTNGCTFKFTLNTFINETEATGSVHIVCPGTNKIQIHVWPKGTQPAEHATKTPLCTFEIGPQGPLGGITYKMSGTAEKPHTTLTINTAVTGIAVSKVFGTLANCGTASQQGEYKSENEVEAFTAGGAMVEATFQNEA